MIPALSLQNFLSWIAQITVVVIAGLLLPALFRIRHSRSQLIYYRLLLALCVWLPLLQSWQITIDEASGNASHSSGLAAIAPTILFVAPGLSLERIGLWILLAGIGLRLCRFLMGLCRLYHYRKAAIVLQPAPDSVVFARRLINCDADVCLSLNDIGPVTFGMGRPTILLPDRFLTLDEEAQRAVVCHELLHVRRNDWFATIIEELVGIAFWFHPAVWWLVAQIRITREKVVDEEVVRRTIARQPYIEALLAMAGAPLEDRIAAPLFLRRRHLMDRMRSLLVSDRVSPLRLVSSYLSMISMLAAASFIAFVAFPLMGQPVVRESIPVATEESFSASAIANRGHDAQQHIYKVGEGITAPFVVSQVEPQYSDTARQERVQGTVLLEGVVETDGSIKVTRIGRSLEPSLDHNARYALEHWRFEPGRLNGLPVPVQLDVEVRFNLQ